MAEQHDVAPRTRDALAAYQDAREAHREAVIGSHANATVNRRLRLREHCAWAAAEATLGERVLERLGRLGAAEGMVEMVRRVLDLDQWGDDGILPGHGFWLSVSNALTLRDALAAYDALGQEAQGESDAT